MCPFVGQVKLCVPFCGSPTKGYIVLHKGMYVGFGVPTNGYVYWDKRMEKSYKWVRHFLQRGICLYCCPAVLELYNFYVMIDHIRRLITIRSSKRK
jgi:hypothetical protein